MTDNENNEVSETNMSPDLSSDNFDLKKISPSLLHWINQLEGVIEPSNKKKTIWTRLFGKSKNIDWEHIGKEVFARKTLMFAAAQDLKRFGLNNSISLAATDVFVEKAQVKLSQRAKHFYIYGIIVTVIAISILIGAGYLIKNGSISDLIGSEQYSLNDEYVLTYIILKITSTSAILISIVYFLFSIAKALFHEATVLLNKRHALRFGRLFVYLKHGHVNFEELSIAFKWNEDFSSAFRDIHVDKATKTIWMKILEIPNEIVKTFLEKSKNEKKIDLQA